MSQNKNCQPRTKQSPTNKTNNNLRSVPATFISQNEIVCHSPTNTLGGAGTSVLISVSNNGLDFEGVSAEYKFVDEVEIYSIFPGKGSVVGGTVVTITGAGFSEENLGSSSCNFGESGSATINVISSTEIRCTTPPSSASENDGFVSLEVTFNGKDFTTSGTQFGYIPDASFTSMSPLFGPVSGGTVLLISGYNFVDSSKLSCKFGAVAVSARFISSSQIECNVPPQIQIQIDNSENEVVVSITMNGADYISPDESTSTTSASFTYRTETTISSITPSFGPSTGGTAITISGANFEFSKSLSCRFGVSSSRWERAHTHTNKHTHTFTHTHTHKQTHSTHTRN